MAKPSNNKSYTEDVVLKKILNDIAEENLENTASPSHNERQKNSYEDDLIKHYREQDALKLRKKYFNIAKIIIVLFIMVFLILLLTINNDTTKATEQIEVKETITPAPIQKPEVIKTSKPKQVEPIITEPKEKTPISTKPAKEIITPPEKPVKTERQIAKERLLEQMKN